MKFKQNNWKDSDVIHSFSRACLNSCDGVRRAMAHARERVLDEYAELAGENGRLLRLALNEAEALAWQTDYPHLFFPALAAEKAHATVSWHRRQRALQRPVHEVAFAE